MELNLYFLFLVGVATFQSVFSAVIISPIVDAIDKCKEETSATEDARQKFIAMKAANLVHSREGKCLVSCTLQKLGMMKGDGSIDNEKSREIFHHCSFGGVEDDTLKLWKSCQSMHGAGAINDKCEFAFNIYKCFLEKQANMERERVRNITLHREECKKEVNVSEEVYKKYSMFPSAADPHEMKCMVKCELDKMGAIAADGSIKHELFRVQQFHWYFNRDSTAVKSFTDSWTECVSNNVPKDDRCVYAYEMSKCVLFKLQERRAALTGWK